MIHQRSVPINADRLRTSILAMARIGATERGGVTRLALSDEDRQARDLLVTWMRSSGLEVRVDDLGTIYGRRAGTDSVAPPVLAGSHLDSVPFGGRFDGALGVLAALEAVRALDDAGVRTRHPIEIVDWTNEEGVRFQPAMFSSGVIAGRVTAEEAHAVRDRDGKSVGEELRRIGYLGDRSARVGSPKACLELHIEQGPVLEREGLAIGVVEGIFGIRWLLGEVQGEADHAGPTPMEMRRDALVAAAQIVLAVRGLPARLGEGFVATVGRFDVHPGAPNIIPGRVRFTVDLRAPGAAVLEQAVAALQEEVTAIGRREPVQVKVEQIWYSEPTHFDPGIVGLVEQICRRRDLPYRRMSSGAGHDAKFMADIAPTGMIFVPSVRGKSHDEDELTSWEDVARGTQVLCDALLSLAGE